MFNPNALNSDQGSENPQYSQWKSLENFQIGSDEKIEQKDWKEVKAEDLKTVEAVKEQLEGMGANQKILDNPAFSRMLSDRLDAFGISTALVAEGKIGSYGQAEYSVLAKGERGDARHHDKSMLDLIVNNDGSIEITSGYMDREKREYFSEAFPSCERGVIKPNGAVECFSFSNAASRTKFSILQNGEGIYTEELESLETQIRPTYNPNRDKNNFYEASLSKSVRCFAEDGKETWREDEQYTSSFLSARGDSIDFLMTGGRDNSEIPKPSTNLLNSYQRYNLGVSARTTYARNEDGTMKVTDTRDGKTVKIERCPIHAEHGDDELIPENGAMREAWNKAE